MDYPQRERETEREREGRGVCQIKGVWETGFRLSAYERLFHEAEKTPDYAYGKRAEVSTVAPEPLGKEARRGFTGKA
ncbi:hypothetical protein IRJ41_000606, partial [Triplophysa rosa]